MKVDKKILNKLSKLSKIEVQENEEEKYLKMINDDLEKLESIDEIDVDNIEPLTNPYDMELRQYPDIVSDGDKVDELMKSTPKSLYNYFIVPKVLDK